MVLNGALPSWTEGPVKPLEVNAAEAWARTVRSAVVVATGKGQDQADVPAVNTESRSLLVALVRRLKPGSTMAIVRLADLSAATGLSTRRIVFCLMLLRRARLLGVAEGVGLGLETVVSVRVLLPEAAE